MQGLMQQFSCELKLYCHHHNIKYTRRSDKLMQARGKIIRLTHKCSSSIPQPLPGEGYEATISVYTICVYRAHTCGGERKLGLRLVSTCISS